VHDAPEGATRGTRSIIAASQKKSPVASRLTCSPPLVTSASPSTITKNSRASLPSRQRTVPGLTSNSSTELRQPLELTAGEPLEERASAERLGFRIDPSTQPHGSRID
jgi:hypothetical protein